LIAAADHQMHFTS